ncbi:class I SAM-dependent methyltransferase [Cryobacterium psychrophilum]|uniref:Methyltransferase domain-containing protein n=1 Tax=Cryobacterium psychrophilum TaxID=41988 RepID=A0A4Y8KNS5_9MICO|nr:methyltransferase [Cryobacterium psychrophilum]TDW30124.1 16S rRNA m(2)G 1207 methyltransferase /23S rRNA m(2)G-1835 methyltransferase [Cryobacterium psychrophilum]TFD79890.1 methyltransferase domain-containing protein [Cryobacterium psychrophilum]
MSESGTRKQAHSASPTDFDFDRLSRKPDVEADNLFAVDASDRLILDEAAGALAGAGSGNVVVLEDRYGALTLGAAALHGARKLRVYQDALSGEHALERNASTFGLDDSYRSLPLGEELLAGARVVLLQIPRSLGELDEIAGAIARYAAPDVLVFAGGRIKHMSVSMNEVLRRHFGALNVTPARQKSRVLIATSPIATGASDWPHSETHDDLGLTVRAHGAAFAGTSVDIGTRALLDVLDRMKPDAESAIDLGCGTGVLAAALALQRPRLRVIASDQSSAAVASARATMDANALAERVTVVRDDALSSRAEDSAELILINPPFHIGSSVHAGIALKLFADAARVLSPGGELWAVWNTHLGYRPELTRIVGPTRQVGRNTKFTVTVSTRR